MAFVIAADERRVADALRDRFPNGPTNEQGPDGQPEHPADLYLHKIVQTTVPLPALSRFDTETYIVLLQLKARLDADQLAPYVERCAALRREAGVLDDLPDVNSSLDISTELTLASRLTPILYEKLRGNPRRIKRFLNDLRVRQSIASRRGISLNADIVAKLMVLEVLLPGGFTHGPRVAGQGRAARADARPGDRGGSSGRLRRRPTADEASERPEHR